MSGFTDNGINYRTRDGGSPVGKLNIFISYRHVDAYYLEPVINDILGEEYGIDCAVWYDEYLTPGKEYDGAIRTALEQSNLCVIIITKDTFEEGCYTAEKEIPYMIENHKQILPIIVADLDSRTVEKALKKAGLVKGINVLDRRIQNYGRRLSTILRDRLVNHDETELVRNALEKENSGMTTPDEDHWIGVGYLYGICDRKQDTKRALKIITAAADRNSSLAMKRLADMYFNGIGVTYDYDKAEEWQIKYIAKINENIEKVTPDGEKVSYEPLRRKYEALQKLCDIRLSSAKLDELNIACRQLMNVASELGGYANNNETLQMRIDCSWSIGRALYADRRLEEAEEHLGDAVAACRELKDAAKDKKADFRAAIDHQLAQILYDYGRVMEKGYRLNEAEQYYSEGYRLLKNLSGSGRDETEPDISGILRHLGEVELKKGDVLIAKKYFADNLSRCRSMLSASDDYNTRYLYANAVYNMAELLFENSSLKEARDSFAEAMDCAAGLLEENDSPDSRRLLAKACGGLGNVLRAEGELEDARVCYLEDIRIMDEILSEVETVQYRRDCGLAYEMLSELCIEMNELEQAEEYLAEARKRFESIQSEHNTRESLLDLAKCKHSLGMLSTIQGNAEMAERHYNDALELQKEAAERSRTPNALMGLCKTYGMLAGIYLKKNDFAKAVEYARMDHDICAELIDSTNMINARRMFSFSHTLLGNIYRKSNEIEYAKKAYSRAVKIAEEVMLTSLTNRSREDYANAMYALVDYYIFIDDVDEAENHVRDIINLRKEVDSSVNSYRTGTQLAKAYQQMGELKLLQYDLAAAQQSVLEAIRIYEGFEESIRRTHDARTNLTHAYGCMTRIMLEQNSLREAEEYAKLDRDNSAQLYDEYQVPESERTYCVALSMYSKVLMRRNERYRSLRLLNKVLGLREERLRKQNTLLNQYPVSKSYIDLGDYYMSLGDPDKARSYYEGALEIRCRLMEELKAPKAIRKCAEAYHRLGKLELAEGNYEAAIRHYQKDGELLERLCRERPMLENTCHLAVVYNRLGDAALGLGRNEEAQGHYEHSLGLLDSIERGKRVTKVQIAIVDDLIDLGDIHLARGKEREAEKFYISAAEEAEPLFNQTLTNDTSEVLLRAYGKLEEFKEKHGDHGAAQHYRSRCEIIREAMENGNQITVDEVNSSVTYTAGKKRSLKVGRYKIRVKKKKNRKAPGIADTLKKLKAAVATLSVLSAALAAAVAVLIYLLTK